MIQKIIVLLIFCIVTTVTGSEWITITDSDPNKYSIEIIESNSIQTIVEVTLPGFYIDETELNYEEYVTIDIMGSNRFSELGQPDIPAISLYLIAEVGTDVEVQTETLLELEYDLNNSIIPVLPSEPDGEIDHHDSQIDQVPATQQSYKVLTSTEWAHLPVAEVLFSPFTYESDTNTLRVAAKTRIVLNTQPSDDTPFTINESDNRYFNNIILNYPEYDEQTNVISDRCVIIFDGNQFSEYMDAIQPYIDWYHYNDDIDFYISTRPGYTPTVNGIICKLYYAYHENNCNFALLVGDHEDVPSKGLNYMSSFFSDEIYADTEDYGGQTYPSPDMAIGRIPGPPSWVGYTVNKIIDRYITYYTLAHPPSTTRGNPNKVVLVADDDTPNFQETCEYIRNYSYSAADLSFETLYEPGVPFGTLMYSLGYNNNTPPGVVVYRGHGSQSTWYDPYLRVYDVENLNNYYWAYVAFNIACSCGNYVDISRCIGEAWLQSGGGACANLAATTTTYSVYNDILIKKIFEDIYDLENYRLGLAVRNGLRAIPVTQDTSQAGICEANKALQTRFSYILFGDPLLMIWTNENEMMHFTPQVEPIELDGLSVCNRDSEEDNIFTIMPSIASESTTLSIVARENSEVSISLYDISGRVRYSDAISTNSSGNLTQIIDTSPFEEGVYFIKVDVDSESYIRRLTVIE